jgi:hypothetical protein
MNLVKISPRGDSRHWQLPILYISLFFISFAWSTPCKGQQKAVEKVVSDSDKDAAKKSALAALKLLHANELSKLYRETFSDLQKSTGLLSEAKAIQTFTPYVQATPGEPRERALLNSHRADTLPVFFSDHKAEYYVFIFLSKYPAGDFQEEVYLVKEKGDWKIAALLNRPTF